MKRTVLFAVSALLIGSVAAVGCDEPDEEAEQQQEELGDQAAELTEEPVEQPEEPEYEEPEFNEDLFVLAAYEKACVETEIDDEERAAAIHEEIFARYGFDEERFGEASEHFGDDEMVELAIETRMERCDRERARRFAEQGAGEMEDAEEADREAARSVNEARADSGDEIITDGPQPPTVGELIAELEGGGFEDTSLVLRVRRNFDIGGQFRGEFNGTDFMIPISGEVGERNDQIDATGERGGFRVGITGNVTEGGASGQISGTIDGQDFQMRYNAQ